jgi:hypothetical protein
MDDEHEEEPQQMFFHPGMTEEQAEMLHATMNSNAHESVRIFDELEEEHLNRFRGILNVIKDDPETVMYFMGIASAHLKFRFGYCMACGLKHDEELAHLVGDGGPDHVEKPDPNTPWGAMEMTKEDYETVVEGHYCTYQTSTGILTCKGCGSKYPDLADRMRSKFGKEGCATCNQKEKWG